MLVQHREPEDERSEIEKQIQEILEELRARGLPPERIAQSERDMRELFRRAGATEH